VAFSPDSRWLVGSGAEGRTLWDVTTRQQIFPWGQKPIPGDKAIFSPDGKLVAYLTLTGTRAALTWRNVADGKVLGTIPFGAGLVTAIAFAPDGRHVVAACTNGTLAVLRLADGPKAVNPVPVPPMGRSPFDGLQRDKIDPEELAVAGNGDAASAPKDLVAVLGSSRLNADNPVTALAFRPGTPQLATIYYAVPAILWDPRTGRRTGQIDNNKTSFTAVAYNPDGKVLALGDNQKVVRLVNPDSRQTIRTLTGHQGAVVAIRFSPDGKRLYSASGSGADPGGIIAWNLETGEKLWSIPVEKPGVAALALSHDGKTLFASAAAWGGEIRLLDTADGKDVRKLDGQEGLVLHIATHPDGKEIAVNRVRRFATATRRMQVLDVETGKELFGQVTGFPSPAYSPDGKLLAVEYGHTVQVLDAKRQVIREIAYPKSNSLHHLAFSPDGATLATGHSSGGVAFWEVATGKPTWPQDAHIGSLTTVSVSGDGGRLVTTGRDYITRVWDVATGRVERMLDALFPHGAAFLPTGTAVATCAQGNLTLWDAATGNQKWKAVNPATFLSLAASPDGTRLLGGLRGDGMKVFDAQSGAETFTTAGSGGFLRTPCWSPDGKWIASESDLPIDLATGKSPFPEEKVKAYAAAFSPDGRFFAWSFNNKVERWDMTTLQKATPLVVNGLFFDMAYSPDGRWLAGHARQGRIDLLDAATGKLDRLFPMPKDSRPNSVSFTPDGRHLLVGNVFGTVYVFRLSE